MPSLVFLPYARLAWIAPLPAEVHALPRLAELVDAGEWPFPADWLAWLSRHFVLPEGLELRAQVQGRLLVVIPWPPLTEKRPGAALALCPPMELKQAQRAVLLRMARGMSVIQVAQQMQHSPRWVKYQLRAVRHARAALLRTHRKKRAGPRG